MTKHSSSNLGKHSTKNPVVKYLMGRYFQTLRSILEPLRPSSILDVGCGEGFTAAMLRKTPWSFDYKGIDLDAGAIEYARKLNPGYSFEQRSIFDLGTERADVVMCLEVLEHLDDPRKALNHLANAAARHIIVSVPWEPWFRLGNLARGKHIAKLGNHPEHIQQFSPLTIHELVAARFDKTQVYTSMPWVFVCGDKRT